MTNSVSNQNKGTKMIGNQVAMVSAICLETDKIALFSFLI